MKNSSGEWSPVARCVRDWMLLFAGAVCGALLLALLNWFLFVRPVPPLTEKDAPRATTFSREKLDEVLSSFEQRRVQYENARRTLPVVADPGK